jgi:hypothetical protein
MVCISYTPIRHLFRINNQHKPTDDIFDSDAFPRVLGPFHHMKVPCHIAHVFCKYGTVLWQAFLHDRNKNDGPVFTFDDMLATAMAADKAFVVEIGIADRNAPKSILAKVKYKVLSNIRPLSLGRNQFSIHFFYNSPLGQIFND